MKRRIEANARARPAGLKGMEATLIVIVAVAALFFFVFTRSLVTYLDAENTPQFDASYARCAAHDNRDDPESPCILWRTTFPQLLGHPAFFHGKVIELSGFAHFAGRQGALYFNSEDYAQALTQNGLLLELRRGTQVDACKNGTAQVIGRFNGEEFGESLQWAGAIQEVVRCRPWF